jgi:hypothetical protein
MEMAGLTSRAGRAFYLRMNETVRKVGRMKTMAVVLAVVAVAVGVMLGRGTPGAGAAGLCPPHDPARAIHLALGDAGAFIGVVEALGERDLDAGTPVRVVEVVAGEQATGETVADRQPTLACLSDGLWGPGQAAFGAFLRADGEIYTLAAWPYVDGEVHVGDERYTIAELMALGEAYVEPTPTPLPEGVPTPPLVEPPHSGTITMPATGTGAGGGGGGVAAALSLAIAGVVVIAAAVKPGRVGS